MANRHQGTLVEIAFLESVSCDKLRVNGLKQDGPTLQFSSHSTLKIIHKWFEESKVFLIKSSGGPFLQNICNLIFRAEFAGWVNEFLYFL